MTEIGWSRIKEVIDGLPDGTREDVLSRKIQDFVQVDATEGIMRVQTANLMIAAKADTSPGATFYAQLGKMIGLTSNDLMSVATIEACEGLGIETAGELLSRLDEVNQLVKMYCIGLAVGYFMPHPPAQEEEKDDAQASGRRAAGGG